MIYLGITAGVIELPLFATLVTKWTHGCVGVANLISKRFKV